MTKVIPIMVILIMWENYILLVLHLMVPCLNFLIINQLKTNAHKKKNFFTRGTDKMKDLRVRQLS